MPSLSIETLIALGRARGLELTPERAESLRPLAESLAARLERLRAALPPEAMPPIAPAPR